MSAPTASHDSAAPPSERAALVPSTTTGNVLLLVALLAGAGCSRGNPAAPHPPVPATTASDAAIARREPAPPSAPGTLRGRVFYDGPPTEERPVDRHSDPWCERRPHPARSVRTDESGGLREVLVRLAGELPAPPPLPPDAPPVRIEQRECLYLPPLQGMRAGQRLEVQNLDGTLHNVHVFRGTQTMLNRSQKEGSGPVGREVPGPPGLLEVKCDVHPWMLAHVLVAEHPWFAVSDEGGRFELAAVPAGHRTLEVWHAALGTRTVEVDIPPGGAASIDVRYAKAPAP